ncbi:NACHT domain-containing protein, partial [Durusdinium trenchii]
ALLEQLFETIVDFATTYPVYGRVDSGVYRFSGVHPRRVDTSTADDLEGGDVWLSTDEGPLALAFVEIQPGEVPQLNPLDETAVSKRVLSSIRSSEHLAELHTRYERERNGEFDFETDSVDVPPELAAWLTEHRIARNSALLFHHMDARVLGSAIARFFANEGHTVAHLSFNTSLVAGKGLAFLRWLWRALRPAEDKVAISKREAIMKAILAALGEKEQPTVLVLEGCDVLRNMNLWRQDPLLPVLQELLARAENLRLVALSAPVLEFVAAVPSLTAHDLAAVLSSGTPAAYDEIQKLQALWNHPRGLADIDEGPGKFFRDGGPLSNGVSAWLIAKDRPGMNRATHFLDGDTVRDVLHTWPHPLPGILLRYWESRSPDDEGLPTEPPSDFAIVDLAGNLLRLLATVQLSHYLQWKRVESSPEQFDAKLNRLILTTVTTGSDGNWLRLLTKTDAAITEAQSNGTLAHPFPVDSLLGGHQVSCCPATQQLPKSCRLPASKRRGDAAGFSRYDVLSVLLEYRNAIIHGAEPADDDRSCAAALLEQLVLSLRDLSRLRVVVFDAEGRRRSCRGLVLDSFPVEESAPRGEEQEYQPFLLGVDGEPRTTLWPFLLYVDEQVAPQLRWNEFCFFSQAGAQAVQYAKFLRPGRVSTRELGKIGDLSYRDYTELMAWVAQHASPEAASPETFDDNTFTEQLCASFVGRQKELERLESWIHNTESGYGAITGEAGSGKSALVAQLRAQSRAGRSAGAEPRIAGVVRFAWHFCARRDRRDDLVLILRSLCRQILDGNPEVFPEPQSLPETVGALRARLEMLLRQVSEFSLSAEHPIKLVLVVDALDEASSYRGGSDVVLANLPAVLPPGVLVVCSYRVDADGTPTIELGERKILLDSILPEPLRPLDILAVRELLRRVVGAAGHEVREDQVQAVYQASGGDPLYLFFLAQTLANDASAMDGLETAPSGIGAFFRRELWNRLPVDNEYAAHRLLLLLGCARSGWTDREVATQLGLSDSEVVFARASLGRYLKYGKNDLGETTYELFHDRLREFVQSEFSIEDQLQMHRELIDAFGRPGFEESADSIGWRHLSYHRFEYGRLCGDFDELFAAADSGFIERKLDVLSNPSAVAEDYALLLRACLLAGDLERAFRTGLERSVISSEVRWLNERGLPRLLARVAPIVDSKQLKTVLGAIDLIDDDATRLEAQLEIAEACLDSEPVETVEAMVAGVLMAVSNIPKKTAIDGILVNATRLIWSRVPALREKLVAELRVRDANLHGVAESLSATLLDWIDEDFIDMALPVFLAGAKKAAEVDTKTTTVDVDPALEGVLEMEDQYSSIDRGKTLRNVAPRILSAFLRPFLWCDAALLDKRLLDAFDRVAQAQDVPAPDLQAVWMRLHARNRDWKSVERALGEAVKGLNRWSSSEAISRLGLVVREVDRPGSPCSQGNRAGFSFLLGDQLFAEARKGIADQLFQADHRSKRAHEIVLILDIGPTGTPAAWKGTSAAGHIAMGALDIARQEFDEALEELHKSQLSSWKEGVQVLTRTALRFPDDREKVERLFHLIRVVETTVSGLLEMSQMYLVHLSGTVLQLSRHGLDKKHRKIILDRFGDAVDVYTSEDARIRMMLLLGEECWQDGHGGEAVDWLSEACRVLAFRDRTTYGEKGFGAAAELAGFLDVESRHVLADTIIRLSRSAVDYGESLGVLTPLFDVLEELDDASARTRLDEALQLIGQADWQQLTGSLLEQSVTAASRFGDTLRRDLVAGWYDRFARADAQERRFWLRYLIPMVVDSDHTEIREQLLNHILEIEDVGDRNVGACRYAESLLNRGHENSDEIRELITVARPKEGDLERMQAANVQRLVDDTGLSKEVVEKMLLRVGEKRKMWDPVEGLDGSIEEAAIDMMLGPIFEKLGDRSREYFKAIARTARVAARTGEADLTTELLSQLFAEAGERMDDEWFEELAETAVTVASGAPQVARALVEFLEDGLLELDQAEWAAHTTRVAVAMQATGQAEAAETLIEDCVRLAELSPRAFPHDAASKVIEGIGRLGETGSRYADRMFSAITQWDDEAIAKAGASAAGAIRFDVDRALFLTRRSDDSSRVEAYVALARTLQECPPDWADYATYRLIESAADLPRDLLLALLTTICVHLPDDPESSPIPRRELAELVMGEEGYGLVWESQAPAPSLAEVAMMCQAVPQRWLSSAMYYRRRLEFIHAEFCLDNLLDALPNAQDDLNVIFHYGDTLKELGKFTEAETWFLRGVARSPEQPLFRQQLVDVMKELKRDPVDILKHAEAIPDDETLQEEAEELRREIARSQKSEADEG